MLWKIELSQFSVTIPPPLPAPSISFLLIMLHILLCLGFSRKTCLTRCLVSYTSETFVLCTPKDRQMDLLAPWGKSTWFLCGRVCFRHQNITFNSVTFLGHACSHFIWFFQRWLESQISDLIIARFNLLYENAICPSVLQEWNLIS